MFNFDAITNGNNEEHNPKWPYIPDHPCRMLIIGGSGSWNTSELLNLISHQKDIDKIYLYVKDLDETKYQLLIKKLEDAGIKHLNDPTAFIEYSNVMDDVYDNINDYYPKRKWKTLIVFVDIIADINTNKKFKAIVKEVFIRCMKLNIFPVFTTQSCFSVEKDVRLNSTHHLILKIHKNRVLQNIAINPSADIGYKDIMKIYREYTSQPHLFLLLIQHYQLIIHCVLEKIF